MSSVVGQVNLVNKLDEEEEEGLLRFKVWGMMVRVLVDVVRIVYQEELEVEYNLYYGDEEIIVLVEEEGSFVDEKDKGKI